MEKGRLHGASLARIETLAEVVEGRPRQANIFLIASGGWIAATIHLRPPQCAHLRMLIKNSFHQFSPCAIPGVTYPGLLRTFALRMGYVFPGRAAGEGVGLGCFGVCGDHQRPPARARSKNTAIPLM